MADAFTEAMKIDAKYAIESTCTPREAYVLGALDARARLARQEATDAECIHVLNVLGTDLGQPTRTDFEWSQAAIRRCREALTAAKEARP